MALALETKKHYTYADYLAWPGDVRYELIDGVPLMMSPAPALTHQIIAGEVYRQLVNQLKSQRRLPLIAPVDVRLPKSGESDDLIDTVVQPDVLVVCDRSKLSQRGVQGAPDWVLEVVSSGNAAHDIFTERRLYERAGVREYWLVHPVDRVLTAHVLGVDGLYGRPHLQLLEGVTDIGVLPGIPIDWNELPQTWLTDAGKPDQEPA